MKQDTLVITKKIYITKIRMKIRRKIIKYGNSLGIGLPLSIKEKGFKFDTELEVNIKKNKIIIIPHKWIPSSSSIKGFSKEGNLLIPKWNDKSVSYRFGDMLDISVKEKEGYSLKLIYDNQEEKYLGFMCGNDISDKWFGNYISKKEFTKLFEPISRPDNYKDIYDIIYKVI